MLTRGQGRAVARELLAPFVAPQTRFSGLGSDLPPTPGSEGGESRPVPCPLRVQLSGQQTPRAAPVVGGQLCPEARGCSPRAGRRAG